MKNILTYKLFENSEYDEDKENLEFILLDLKDLGLHYSIFGGPDYKSEFLTPASDNWYKNTKVEKDFKEYLCLYIATRKKDIIEVLNITNECIRYMTNNGWKYSTKLERGVRITDINIEEIPSLFEDEIVSKYIGQIIIHFWK